MVISLLVDSLKNDTLALDTLEWYLGVRDCEIMVRYVKEEMFGGIASMHPLEHIIDSNTAQSMFARTVRLTVAITLWTSLLA